MNKPNNGYFAITSVHRADLEGLGYDVSNVDDATMAELANKLAAPTSTGCCGLTGLSLQTALAFPSVMQIERASTTVAITAADSPGVSAAIHISAGSQGGARRRRL